jgi:hypothetical protein
MLQRPFQRRGAAFVKGILPLLKPGFMDGSMKTKISDFQSNICRFRIYGLHSARIAFDALLRFMPRQSRKTGP